MIRAYLRERKFDTPWLFAGERGDQLSRHAVQYIVRQAATRARLSAHPHTLRHSCGYYLADRGTEFRTMQDYMGHKNPRHAHIGCSMSSPAPIRPQHGRFYTMPCSRRCLANGPWKAGGRPGHGRAPRSEAQERL